MKFPYKDEVEKVNYTAIIINTPKDKDESVYVVLAEKNSQYQKATLIDRKLIQWNKNNIRFIWNYDDLSTFRELYNMLKIFSLEYIISEWNNTLNDKDEDIFNVECVFDQNYVDSDFEQFLFALENKGISINCNYDNEYIRFTDIDGTVFEVRTTETENRYDSDVTETIVFWDTLSEVI